MSLGDLNLQFDMFNMRHNDSMISAIVAEISGGFRLEIEAASHWWAVKENQEGMVAILRGMSWVLAEILQCSQRLRGCVLSTQEHIRTLLEDDSVILPADLSFSAKAVFYKYARANLIKKEKIWRAITSAHVCGTSPVLQNQQSKW